MDIIQIADEEQLPAILKSLDFEKAFDRVEMNALIGTLKYYNFCKKFINYMILLYNSFESCMTNLGYVSDLFKSIRGLHQGCPTSSVLFLLIVEIVRTRYQK